MRARREARYVCVRAANASGARRPAAAALARESPKTGAKKPAYAVGNLFRNLL